MKLTELDPTFVKILKEEPVTYQTGVPIEEAQGIQFLCPKCFEQNHGPIGTHVILCWIPSVDQKFHPSPGRWSFVGTGFENLTLQANSSSVRLMGGCNAHFFVRNGDIVNA